MKIALYIIAGMNVLSALLVIGFIGKPRKPVTPASAVGSVIAAASCATVLIMAAGQLR